MSATPRRIADLSRQQADQCHEPAWSEVEIEAFIARRDRLRLWGYSADDADALAERFTLRDRERDDRRSCAECRHGRNQRCPDGIPLPLDTLHRCSRFGSEGGAT